MMFKVNLLRYVSVIITIFLLVSCTSKTTENQTSTTTTTTTTETTTSEVTEPNKSDTPGYEDVVFQTLDGKEVKVSDYKGKRVLLNFWATWCRPCVGEMPSLDNAYKTLKEEGYVFLAASNEKVSKINNFAQKNPYTFTFIKADDQFRPFNIQVIPTTIIFDTNGAVAMTLTGGMAWDEEEVMSKLRSVK